MFFVRVSTYRGYPFISLPTQMKRLSILSMCLLALSGCRLFPSDAARVSDREAVELSTAVDTAIARRDFLIPTPEYTGTTAPQQTITLRSRVEGEVMQVNVDVGDRVEAGDMVVGLDDRLLQGQVDAAAAQLEVRRAELRQNRARIGEIRARLEQARAELRQAELDAQRFAQLQSQGAVSRQEAELEQTELLTAQQRVRSLQEEVFTQEQAVVAAQERLTVQEATLGRSRELLSFSRVVSPVDGVVLSRSIEPGNLVRVGDELFSIGDFNQITIIVEVSERELGTIRTGDEVRVRFDALPGKAFVGRVGRISPVADPRARLVPVEVFLSDPEAPLVSGLLARVTFADPDLEPEIVVPNSALEVGSDSEVPSLYILDETGNSKRVVRRQVSVGDRADGRTEIISGLSPGEIYIVRSSRPLEDGQAVRESAQTRDRS